MTRAIIIDDEELNRDALEVLLKQNFPELDIVGQAKDVRTGLKAIQELEPQVVFLDIQMPDGSGFDLLRQVKTYNFEVIFITAHDEYALDAFRASAIGYLLKPIDETELRTVVAKAIELCQVRNDNRQQQIKALADNYAGQGKMHKIVVPDAEGFQIITITDIIYLQGDRNYTKVVFADNHSMLSSFNLGWFEKLLTNEGFFRISKSHMINLAHATRYTKGEGGSVVMVNNDHLPIAVNKRDELKQHFL